VRRASSRAWPNPEPGTRNPDLHARRRAPGRGASGQEPAEITENCGPESLRSLRALLRPLNTQLPTLNQLAAEGLKARDVTAWGEAPGARANSTLPALQGRHVPRHETVPAFQASGEFSGHVTWASARDARFSPGYNRTGLRPCRGSLFQPPDRFKFVLNWERRTP